MKKIMCVLFTLSLVLALAMPALAAGKVLVVDDMAKISEKSLDELNAYAQRISGEYRMDVAFFLPSNAYAPGQTLSEHTRERWPDIQDGFVLVHDLDGKLWNVVCFGQAEQIMTEEAEDQFWAAYSDEDEETYYDGAMAYLREAEAFLQQAAPAGNAAAADVLRDPGTLSLLMDEAGLLSSGEATQLLEKLQALSSQWENDIVIVTVDSIGGKTPMEYADDYFDYNDYGQGGDYDGLLLLINMEERDWWISTTGYAISAFTDAGIEFLGKQLASDGLSDGDYAKAFNSFAGWCDKFFKKAAAGKPYDVGNLPKGSSDVVKLVFFAFGGGLIAAWIVTNGMKKKLKTVQKKQQAADYVRPGSLQVAYANEQFLFRNVTRVRVESSSSSGGGGSSTHSGSSGRSHGGGGGKF